MYEESIDNVDKHPVIIRLLTALLLVDVSFLDRSEAASEMIKKVDQFTKASKSRLIVELICQKLLPVYNTPNVGDKNPALIQRL